MKVKVDSLNCVINGDWNKLYVQPKWIGEQLFRKNELEISLKGIGSEVSVSYKVDNVVVNASQEQFVFATINIEQDTLKTFESTLKLFFEIAKTPELTSYGLNCSFVESDLTKFAGVIDDMADSQLLTEAGILIKQTNISRKLEYEGKIINLKIQMASDELVFEFNEHHSNQLGENNIIADGDINNFLQLCKDIVLKMNYELEKEEEE